MKDEQGRTITLETVKHFATRWGKSKQAIYDRIQTGTITAAHRALGNLWYIELPKAEEEMAGERRQPLHSYLEED